MIPLVIREINEGETTLAYAAIHALRPHLRNAEEFAHRVDTTMRPTGYRLVGAFDDLAPLAVTSDAPLPSASVPHALAVMGFRYGDNLARGTHVYIDDLSTLPEARGRGYGAALLAWAREEAARLGCAQLHLDSGVGLDRMSAHRLYFNSGYRISSHHFARTLD
ncbi:MAG: GNAT family N-acetyltransferase [Nocardioidaceae bacterium]|nr:GNAT family N-acetyltransferase [Nocardioidaceae bacterium]